MVKAGGAELTALYVTGDALMSEAIRQVQKNHGYVDVLVPYVGAQPGADGGDASATGKEAMQFVYRMQPKRVVPVHHTTFSHYREPIDDFQNRIGLTIYEKKLVLLQSGQPYER